MHDKRRVVKPWKPSRRAVAKVSEPLPVPTECRYCGAKVELAKNSTIYGREVGDWPWVYKCTRCDAHVGLHPYTGIPMGTLANKELRAARQAAKAVFNRKWQSQIMTREQAYGWLAKQLGVPIQRCHIGWFDVAICQEIVQICTR